MTAPVAVPTPAQQEREKIAAAWHYVFADERGQYAVKRVLALLGTYASVLPRPGENGNQIWINGGQQTAGQELVAEILDHVPGMWMKFYENGIKDLMQKEKR